MTIRNGAILLSLLGVFSATQSLAANFDGRWSVEVITDQGDCDRAYRWSLGVRRGQVTEMGDDVAQASGRIAPNGRVALQFVRGQDVLTARGAMSGGWGQGTWVSPTRRCAGRWRAERRG